MALLLCASRWTASRRILPLATTTARASSSSNNSSSNNHSFVDERGLVQFDTLHNMQERSCQVFSEKKLFGTYSESSKQFEWQTYAEFADQVTACRAVLADLGVTANDKVGIISNNRWEWAALASAAYSLNANCVPMYQAQLPTDWTYILNDSQAKVVFCATQDIFHRVRTQVAPNCPALQSNLCLDAPVEEEHSLAAALARVSGTTATTVVVPPTPDDLANLIYTSGTTGKPKGVELTHENFCSNVKAAARSMVQNPHDLIKKDDCSLAFLPWAHSYGQTCELWMGLSHGSAIAVSRGIPDLLDDLQLVRPTVLFSVPTLYKRIFDGVHNLMETASPVRKRLMSKALQLGRRKIEGDMSWWEKSQFSVLDSVVLSKIRDRFGGRLRHGFVAGAACPAEILDFMDDVGVPVCEGYGLTETSPIIAITVPENRKVGAVGRVIGEVKVYIMGEDGKEVAAGEEGEICCSGPNVMRGYYNNPEATDEVISTGPDGSRMFHTGDIGRLDADGFLKVTGRIKEQYKLENGKYVVPGPIEEAISLSRFVTQVVLSGDNRPYSVALLVPEWPAIRTAIGDDKTSEEELAKDPRVKELIDHAVEQHCAGMKKFEIPQKWALVPPFTLENNMLTPKMSIRRHVVMTTYADITAQLYGDEVGKQQEAA